jgi:hypothetical protein
MITRIDSSPTVCDSHPISLIPLVTLYPSSGRTLFSKRSIFPQLKDTYKREIKNSPDSKARPLQTGYNWLQIRNAPKHPYDFVRNANTPRPRFPFLECVLGEFKICVCELIHLNKKVAVSFLGMHDLNY